MWCRSLAYLLLVLSPLFARPAAADEIVVFTHGGYTTVSSYTVDGDRIVLDLKSGARLEMSIFKIDRIVEDEVATPDPPTEPEPPTFDWRFADQEVPPGTYGPLIFETAKRHDLNPALLAAVAVAESSFDPRAVSVKGARGLMQLMPATARRFGLEGDEVFDPAKSLDAGARYLVILADLFDERLEHILAAYNAGEGTVTRYGGVPPYRETRNYIQRIYRELGLMPPAKP